MHNFKYIVIGKGLIGSAATRYLSNYSDGVAVIGPDEPANKKTHDGVFASHYDQGRLTRIVGRDIIWSKIARRAINNYRMLEQRSGIKFHHPVGLLVADHPGMAPDRDNTWLHTAQLERVAISYYEPGDLTWQERFPFIRFPVTRSVVHEPAPAGYIHPRQMLSAQLAVAEQQGATIIRDIVSRVQQDGDGVDVSTAKGNRYRAERVLVAAGGFSNFHNLLPRPIALKLKTETIILGRVSESEAERLRNMPVIIHSIEDDELNNIYMVPPVRYPDGHYYVKMGGSTIADQSPTTLQEVQHWFREGNSDIMKEAMERGLRSVLPNVEFLSTDTKRCLFTITPSTFPSIDAVDERIFVATGGNGKSAKGSDTLGALAAGLLHDGSWLPNIPRDPFRARYDW